jgi:hypothetical protein
MVSLPDSPYMLEAHQACYPFGVGKLVPVSTGVNGSAPQYRPCHGTTMSALKITSIFGIKLKPHLHYNSKQWI